MSEYYTEFSEQCLFIHIKPLLIPWTLSVIEMSSTIRRCSLFENVRYSEGSFNFLKKSAPFGGVRCLEVSVRLGGLSM